MKTRYLVILVSAATLFIALPGLFAQAGGPKDAADWPMYNRDPAGTRILPLTQINTKNASKLKLAWSYRAQVRRNGPGRAESQRVGGNADRGQRRDVSAGRGACGGAGCRIPGKRSGVTNCLRVRRAIGA